MAIAVPPAPGYHPGMGVTAHFFAFDPRVYTTPPTVARLLESGHVDPELRVLGEANAWLREVDSPLGNNKRWYDNLAGDLAWSRARSHVAPDLRAALDRWLSHLFWDADAEGCPQKWRGEAASRPDACGAPLHLVGGVTGPGGHRRRAGRGRVVAVRRAGQGGPPVGQVFDLRRRA